MKVELWMVGKNEFYVSEGMEIFAARIKRYIHFEIKFFAESRKRKTPELLKAGEAELILSRLEQRDYLIILDARGKEYASENFAALLNGLMNTGKKKVIFLIGGAYGFHEDLYARADERLSLSKMTFSHQIVRLLFAEQLYRAFTIINREPYHHA